MLHDLRVTVFAQKAVPYSSILQFSFRFVTPIK